MPTDVIYFTWFGVHIQLFPAARVPNEITLSLYRGKAWVFKTYIYIFFIYPTSFVFTTLVWQLYEGSRKAVAGQCNKREMIESIFFPSCQFCCRSFAQLSTHKKEIQLANNRRAEFYKITWSSLLRDDSIDLYYHWVNDLSVVVRNLTSHPGNRGTVKLLNTLCSDDFPNSP